MRSRTKSVFLRNRKYVFVGGSLLPRSIEVSLDATGDSRWIRIGLIPGLGRFRNTRRFFSMATGLWIKAPESRTGSVVNGPVRRRYIKDDAFYAHSDGDGTDVVRWGLLSTASINKAVIPPMRRSGRHRLVAVASRDLERASQFSSAWRIQRAFGTYEEMLASDVIDAVYIPVPNRLHAEWCIKAMEAGKHVLCEKPLAQTVAEVDAIEQTALRTRRVVAEAFMYRHHERTKQVKKLLDTGIIGDIRSIRGAFTFPLADPTNIRLDKSNGGGSLWDVGCYPVSFARYLVGKEPLEVSGFQRIGPTGVDLHFSGQMRFPGDITTQFEAGFDAPLRMEMTIVGSNGTIDLPAAFKPGRTSSIIVYRDGDEADHRIVDSGELYRGQLEDIAQSVLFGSQPLIPLSDSRENVRTILALYESARTGRIVSPLNLE